MTNNIILRKNMLHKNLTINDSGRLCIANRDTVELAQKYGTPLMVMDEARIRRNFSVYKTAMEKYFGEGSYPLFASKAFSYSIFSLAVIIFCLSISTTYLSSPFKKSISFFIVCA